MNNYRDVLTFLKQYLESSYEEWKKRDGEDGFMKFVSPYVYRRTPEGLYEHSIRTFYAAKKIAAYEDKVSVEVVELAALLHDIGKYDSYIKGIKHADAGAEIARAFLKSKGYSPVTISKVCNVIKNHSSREKDINFTIEEKIVMDAEAIDEQGVMSVLWDAISETLTRGSENVSYDNIFNRMQKYSYDEANKTYSKLKTIGAREIMKRRINHVEYIMNELKSEMYKNEIPMIDITSKDFVSYIKELKKESKSVKNSKKYWPRA